MSGNNGSGRALGVSGFIPLIGPPKMMALLGMELESEMRCQSGVAYLLVASSAAMQTLTEVSLYFPSSAKETGETFSWSGPRGIAEGRPGRIVGLI